MNTSDHILIVTTTVTSASCLPTTSRSPGLRCTTAADGREMKAALETHRIDPLSSLDLMMPGSRDGLTLCRNPGRAAGRTPTPRS